ncbi:MAG: hypothetical protein NC311_10035 [Muribaculaceae bacterium]|nr:hypothetical protein [Muribaculaceae bacterium]
MPDIAEKYTDFKTDFTAPKFQFEATPEQKAAWKGNIRDLAGRQDLESVIRALAALTSLDPVEAMGYAYDRQAAMKSAMHWLETLRQRLEAANRSCTAVRLIKTHSVMANSDGEPIPGTEIPVVFAYNSQNLDDDAAMKLMDSGAAEWCDQVVKMTPMQAHYLFPGHDAGLFEEDKKDG